MTRPAAALAICAALLAGTATAERGPECGWNLAESRFEPGSPLPAWVNPVDSPGFVTTYVPGETGTHVFLLHHCPTDAYLMASTGAAGYERVRERFALLIESRTRYTLDAFGAELETQGAEVRRGKGDIGRCDCEAMAKLGLVK